MDAREQAIQSAIRDLNSGVHTSRRAAAKAYGIPPSTLGARLRGATDSTTSHAHQQRLTPEQESFLVDWILEQDMNGYPPSHARAREMAIRILRMNGDLEPLGKRWLPSFIKRNPRVAPVIGRKLEARRAEASTPARDIYAALKSQLGSERLSRADRIALEIAGKALAITNARVARQEAKMWRLEYQLLEAQADEYRSESEPEGIRRAIDQAAASAAQVSTSIVSSPTQTSDTFGSMCIDWQL